MKHSERGATRQQQRASTKAGPGPLEENDFLFLRKILEIPGTDIVQTTDDFPDVFLDQVFGSDAREGIETW